MSRQIGLVGSNIGYSLSPRLHRAALAAADLDWEYSLLDTAPHQLPAVVDKLRSAGWAGANVTRPYKKRVLSLLDEIHDSALTIGAVNTIVNCGGRLKGFNTDVTGLARDFQRLGISLERARVAILGTGGGAAAALALTGRSQVSIICRRRQQGLDLADKLMVSARVLPWIPSGETYDLLINGTPPGSDWQEFSPCAGTIYDLNYHESNPPPGNYHNGLGMLVFQAEESFRLWTGFSSLQAMAAAVHLTL